MGKLFGFCNNTPGGVSWSVTTEQLHGSTSVLYEHYNKWCQVFNNNPQRSRLRGQARNRRWNCVRTGINRCKIKNWKERSKNGAGWEKSIQEATVSIGLQCHLRRRRRRRRRRMRRRRRRRRRKKKTTIQAARTFLVFNNSKNRSPNTYVYLINHLNPLKWLCITCIFLKQEFEQISGNNTKLRYVQN